VFWFSQITAKTASRGKKCFQATSNEKLQTVWYKEHKQKREQAPVQRQRKYQST
jgi:hypothetical protein